MTTLEEIARSQRFLEASKSERAEMILWFLHVLHVPEKGILLSQVSDAFHELELVRPKPERIRAHFKSSRNIRRIQNGGYAPSRDFSKEMSKDYPAENNRISQELEIDELEFPPFVPDERRDDLKRMVQMYARLFLLENSMRGLIQEQLSKALGAAWWEQVANAKMKKKHKDRIDNENKKKWAPARSDFGPLYALDWPDLVTIVRKYPQYFEDAIKELSFLHRFEDAGTYRNIVAHNGVLKDEDDFELIRIYYRDWIKQLA